MGLSGGFVPEYWNHNVHYHPVVLGAVPEGCETALDVGAGDGYLAHKLAGRVPHVTGIDSSAGMVALAREQYPEVEFVDADFLEWSGGEYDFVCSVATIHHMDFEAALGKMADLLRPGGTLVVISLARSATLAEFAFGALGFPVTRALRLVKGSGGPAGMPMKDPTMSYGEVGATARRLLPGARFRRHVLWRYSIIWRKP
jgi:SAM-dependent methyltransferase